MTSLDFTPLSPITGDQKLADFDCGELSLNEWLKKRAFRNHLTGASRCFVLCAGKAVIGYYLSRGFVESPLQPMTLLITIETIRSILAEPD